jgi:hypothetical protein
MVGMRQFWTYRLTNPRRLLSPADKERAGSHLPRMRLSPLPNPELWPAPITDADLIRFRRGLKNGALWVKKKPRRSGAACVSVPMSALGSLLFHNS